MTSNSIRGILLAAGSSSRFGSNKLLHPSPSSIDVGGGIHAAGTPIAVASARNLAVALRHFGSSPLAVVRPGVPELEAALRAAGCDIVVCEQAGEGMGHSLARAVEVSDTGAGGWLVALADMPFIRPDTMLTIANHVVQGAMVAAPLYQGQRGHPVCFSARLRDQLLSLTGDEGARKVFQPHAAGNLMEVDDPGVLRDIDRPGDLG